MLVHFLTDRVGTGGPPRTNLMRVFKRGDHSLSVRTDAGVVELTMLF